MILNLYAVTVDVTEKAIAAGNGARRRKFGENCGKNVRWRGIFSNVVDKRRVGREMPLLILV